MRTPASMQPSRFSLRSLFERNRVVILVLHKIEDFLDTRVTGGRDQHLHLTPPIEKPAINQCSAVNGLQDLRGVLSHFAEWRGCRSYRLIELPPFRQFDPHLVVL